MNILAKILDRILRQMFMGLFAFHRIFRKWNECTICLLSGNCLNHGRIFDYILKNRDLHSQVALSPSPPVSIVQSNFLIFARSEQAVLYHFFQLILSFDTSSIVCIVYTLFHLCFYSWLHVGWIGMANGPDAVRRLQNVLQVSFNHLTLNIWICIGSE